MKYLPLMMILILACTIQHETTISTSADMYPFVSRAVEAYNAQSDEKIEIVTEGGDLVAGGTEGTIIGEHRFAIIVNPSNEMDDISPLDLQSIIEGRIDSWVQLGMDYGKMDLIMETDESSKLPYPIVRDDYQQAEEGKEVVQSVGMQSAKIGIIRPIFISNEVKVLTVGGTRYDESRYTFKTTFKIDGNHDFINFCTGPIGKAILEDLGYSANI